jgi:hypothetical protein
MLSGVAMRSFSPVTRSVFLIRSQSVPLDRLSNSLILLVALATVVDAIESSWGMGNF